MIISPFDMWIGFTHPRVTLPRQYQTRLRALWCVFEPFCKRSTDVSERDYQILSTVPRILAAPCYAATARELRST